MQLSTEWWFGALIVLRILILPLPAQSDVPANDSTHFVLVNAETGADIVNLEQDMVVDTSIVGSQSLTVRAETANYTGPLLWELGGTRRVETRPPYYLAGSRRTEEEESLILEVYPSNVLRKAGPHTVTITPVSSVFLEDVASTIDSNAANRSSVTFFIQHGSFAEDSISEDDVTSEPDCDTLDTTATCDFRATTDVPAVDADVYGRWNDFYSNGSSVRILAFTGPMAGENGMTDPGTYRAPSTFADYRCDLRLQASNATAIVPCFYSGTGNAANTGDTGGWVWQCLVRMDNTSVPWLWNVSFVQGTNVASTTYLSGSLGSPGAFFNGQSGTLSPPTGTLGRNRHHDTSSAPFWTGIHSVDFLNYIDFDGMKHTNQTNTYAAFVNETSGHTNILTWGGGRGRGIMGLLTKIGENGSGNVLSFTTLSDNVFPFIDPTDRLAYDISKLAQWEAVLAYAVQTGVSVILILQAERISDVDERNLYIREMVARFGPFVASFVVGSLETAKAIRALSGANSIGEIPSIFWRIDSPIYVEPVSVADSSGIDGVILGMFAPTTNEMFNALYAWKSTNPTLTIVSIVDIPDDSSSLLQSRLLWSHAFAGGSGILIQAPDGSPNDPSTDLGPISVLTETLLNVTRTIVYHFSRESFLRPNSDVILHHERNDTWCLADVALYTILIYRAANMSDTLELFLDDKQYTLEWIDSLTGVLVNGTLSIVNDSTPLLPSPPSNTTDWIARLFCTTNCSIQTV